MRSNLQIAITLCVVDDKLHGTGIEDGIELLGAGFGLVSWHLDGRLVGESSWHNFECTGLRCLAAQCLGVLKEDIIFESAEFGAEECEISEFKVQISVVVEAGSLSYSSTEIDGSGSWIRRALIYYL